MRIGKGSLGGALHFGPVDYNFDIRNYIGDLYLFYFYQSTMDISVTIPVNDLNVLCLVLTLSSREGCLRILVHVLDLILCLKTSNFSDPLS